MKKGIGILIDLGQAAAVSSVKVELSAPRRLGLAAGRRRPRASTKAGDKTIFETFKAVGGPPIGEDTGTTMVFSTDARQYHYLLVWITELPMDPTEAATPTGSACRRSQSRCSDRAETPDDGSCCAAHAAGDPDAFGELFRRHRDRLWAVALRTLHDREDAADALQDALLSAYRAAARFRGEAAVTTWLHRIVVNACLDRFRRRQAHPTVPLPERHGRRRPAPAARARAPAPTTTPPWSYGTRWPQLPDEQRAALVLVDVQGYSVAEVAQLISGVAEGTMKSRCSRGRARLAVMLGHLRNSAGRADRDVGGNVRAGRSQREGGADSAQSISTCSPTTSAGRWKAPLSDDRIARLMADDPAWAPRPRNCVRRSLLVEHRPAGAGRLDEPMPARRAGRWSTRLYRVPGVSAAAPASAPPARPGERRPGPATAAAPAGRGWRRWAARGRRRGRVCPRWLGIVLPGARPRSAPRPRQWRRTTARRGAPDGGVAVSRSGNNTSRARLHDGAPCRAWPHRRPAIPLDRAAVRSSTRATADPRRPEPADQSPRGALGLASTRPHGAVPVGTVAECRLRPLPGPARA